MHDFVISFDFRSIRKSKGASRPSLMTGFFRRLRDQPSTIETRVRQLTLQVRAHFKTLNSSKPTIRVLRFLTWAFVAHRRSHSRRKRSNSSRKLRPRHRRIPDVRLSHSHVSPSQIARSTRPLKDSQAAGTNRLARSSPTRLPRELSSTPASPAPNRPTNRLISQVR